MNQNLEKIIDGCMKWHRDSQRLLYKEFYSYGMSITFRYVKNESDAETVVNDTFLKVFNNIKKFDRNQAFKPWFRRILVNTSINYLKKHNRLAYSADLLEVQNMADKETILSNISYKELIKMVNSLSQAYSTVFNMFVIDGFKHDEIAEKLGISVGTSKSNLSKARAKLKVLIEQQLILENE